MGRNGPPSLRPDVLVKKVRGPGRTPPQAAGQTFKGGTYVHGHLQMRRSSERLPIGFIAEFLKRVDSSKYDGHHLYTTLNGSKKLFVKEMQKAVIGPNRKNTKHLKK